jgi:DNA-nicking Smr family endonuclease
MKIDLHGIKHENVSRQLDIFFWEMMQKNVPQVEVVTGISNRMKEIVRKTCKDYNFEVIENTINIGSVFVKLK